MADLFIVNHDFKQYRKDIDIPEIISDKHFKVSPINADHSCSQSYRARTGVCWLTEPSISLVISDDMLRSYFAASQEELNTLFGSGAVKPIMSEIELFDVSVKYLAPRRGEESIFTNGEWVLSVGFGNDFATGELLCLMSLVPLWPLTCFP